MNYSMNSKVSGNILSKISSGKKRKLSYHSFNKKLNNLKRNLVINSASKDNGKISQ